MHIITDPEPSGQGQFKERIRLPVVFEIAVVDDFTAHPGGKLEARRRFTAGRVYLDVFLPDVDSEISPQNECNEDCQGMNSFHQMSREKSLPAWRGEGQSQSP